MEPTREPLETPSASPPEGEGAEAHPMDAFLEEEAYGMDSPRRGETRTGTIARISGNDILVDIGAKSEGVLPASEVELMTEEQRAELVVGRELPVYIVRTGDRDFGIVLSAARAMEETDWTRAETLQQDQSVYEGSVAGYNKGGLIVKVGNLRGFVPAAQQSLSPPGRGGRTASRATRGGERGSANPSCSKVPRSRGSAPGLSGGGGGRPGKRARP